MEITKREIVASITIVALMMILGFVITGKIDAYQIQKNSEYYKAVHITDPDQFKYCMNTSVGNAFVYGMLEAVDPVTFQEIGGEYLYVKKVEEHYTAHTRMVTTTDSKGNTHTRTEIYWSWDYVGEEEKHSEKIRFLGVEMGYEKIEMPRENYVKTIEKSSHVRYEYYGVLTGQMGTIYTNLRNNAILDNSKFFSDCDIESAVTKMTTSMTWLFWVSWIVLIGVVVYGFYYLDNEWLN